MRCKFRNAERISVDFGCFYFKFETNCSFLNARMRECENARMRECENARMRECENIF